MEHVLSLTRKCIAEYKMIENGDKIAVGVSGGKDSMVLLYALARLRSFYNKKFEIFAVTVDTAPDKSDFSSIKAFCKENDIQYSIVESNIFEVVFDIRKEENPCALCAKMRRGIFHDEAKRLGCNKIALGHNFNDAVETFLLSQIYEGRISCFSPVTYLDRKDLTQIRPILYLDEDRIRNAAQKGKLPIVKNPCPVDGDTKREEIKNFVKEMDGRYPGYSDRIFRAMQRLPLKGWEVLDSDPRKSAKNG